MSHSKSSFAKRKLKCTASIQTALLSLFLCTSSALHAILTLELEKCIIMKRDEKKTVETQSNQVVVVMSRFLLESKCKTGSVRSHLAWLLNTHTKQTKPLNLSL